MKNYALCLGNISKSFTNNNMKKAGLTGVVKFFSVDFNPVNNNDILDINKYLMKRTLYKINVWNYKKNVQTKHKYNESSFIFTFIFNLHLKNIFKLKESLTFANLLMEKPGN